MVKLICDKCLEEVPKLTRVFEYTEAKDAHGATLVTWPKASHELCDSCNKMFERLGIKVKDFMNLPMDELVLLDNTFKVGDEVVTSTGKVGVITSVCTCDHCKERGFYELTVRISDNEVMYITNTDKKRNFADFYKIGNRIFGNIDEDSISDAMNSVNSEIKSLAQRKRTLCEQQQVLNKIKQNEDEMN